MSAFDEEKRDSHLDDEPETLPMFPDESADDDAWTGEELERAYQEAVDAIDHIEQELPIAKSVLAPEDSAQSFNDFPSLAEVSDSVNAGKDDAGVPQEHRSGAPRLQPAQIVEAALFVGGMPLTVKRLAGVLRNEFDRDFIERTIDEINLRYDDQNRPYEIRLDEGGYRMVLRREFESVRNKSYGFGPKEVRLSQEVLEVLALVAYRQPISKEQIEKTGKTNPNGAIRQLLRREIIALERTGKSAKEVHYHTTPRFLQIFGLADLSELPLGEDLSFK